MTVIARLLILLSFMVNIVGNLEGMNHMEDLDVDGRIILEWILGKQRGKIWIGSSGSG
jgi:hypothetical protein